MVSLDSLKFTIIPLVKKMCEQSLRAEDSVMVKISEQFGKLCLGLESEYCVFQIDILGLNSLPFTH